MARCGERKSQAKQKRPKIGSVVRRHGGWDASNPRQEKRRQKGSGAAYNSGLMAGWTKRKVAGWMMARWVAATQRNSNGKKKDAERGRIARERITRSLPVAPARASASGRAAHCSSCFNRHRGSFVLFLLPLSIPRAQSRMVWSPAFLTPFFTEEMPLSPPLVLVRKPRPLSGAGPRCSETSHNGVTWPLLSRSHTPGHTSIAYTSSPLAASHSTEVSSLFLPRSAARVALCMPPRQINGGCGGPFGPDSCTSIIQVGAKGCGGVQDA